MPEGTPPAEEGRGEVAAPPADEAERIVVHHEPVRIPFGALPPRPRPAWHSRFSTTFVIGSAASMWFAAALVTGDRTAVYGAAGWLVILILDLGLALRR